jgi:succinate dehydrogenase/fumarate reductase flavoprotein subunit
MEVDTDVASGTSQSRTFSEADVLVVGGGLAGCTAAIKARHAGASVILVDKGYAGKSGQTPFAGSYCVFNPEWGDDLDAWMLQVDGVGEYVNNRVWTRLCFEESYERYGELMSWGVRFGADGSARPGVEPERGGMPIGPCRAVMMDVREPSMALRREVLRQGAVIVDRTMIVELLVSRGRAVGAIGFPMDHEGQIHAFTARAVVLAAGAGGFRPTRWPIDNLTSDADCMAYRVGAEVTGKEFADPHAGRADWAASSSFGRLGRSPDGGRPPRGTHHDAEGRPLEPTRGLYLNLDFEAHEGRAPLWFHLRGGGSYQVVGGAAGGMSVHKAEGIWPAGTDCSCNVPGLYAAGDSLGTMQSGATYAAIGQSVLGCSVTGAHAGASAAAFAAAAPVAASPDALDLDSIATRITAPLRRSSGFSPRWVTQMLQNTMLPYYVMYVKHCDRLRAALTNVEFFRDHLVPKLYAADQHELRLVHETRNMLLNAEMRLRASLFRTETRGCHYREDYPLRNDDEWLAWVIIRKEGAAGAGAADGAADGAAAEAAGSMAVFKRPIPAEWHPDPSLPYGERYPNRVPGEDAALAALAARGGRP